LLPHKNKYFISIILLLFFVFNGYCQLSKEKAKKMDNILKYLDQGIMNPNKLIIREDQINSYFHFYREKIFNKNVKFIRVRFKKNKFLLRMVAKLESIDKKMLFFLKDKRITLIADCSINNLLREKCFKLQINSLYINDINISKNLYSPLLKKMDNLFAQCLEGCCLNYPVDRIYIREKNLKLMKLTNK